MISCMILVPGTEILDLRVKDFRADSKHHVHLTEKATRDELSGNG